MGIVLEIWLTWISPQITLDFLQNVKNVHPLSIIPLWILAKFVAVFDNFLKVIVAFIGNLSGFFVWLHKNRNFEIFLLKFMPFILFDIFKARFLFYGFLFNWFLFDLLYFWNITLDYQPFKFRAFLLVLILFFIYFTRYLYIFCIGSQFY